MAYSKVSLSGQIVKMRKTKKNDKTVQITIDLRVMHRPLLETGRVNCSTVIVAVQDEEQINYLEKNKADIGGLLSLYGSYCASNSKKQFFCQECGDENSYTGDMTFISPEELCFWDKTISSENILAMESKEVIPENIKDVGKCAEKLTDAQKYIIQTIGDTGYSEAAEIIKETRRVHTEIRSDSRIRSDMCELLKTGGVDRLIEAINLQFPGLPHFRQYNLSPLGRDIYRYLFGKEAAEPEEGKSNHIVVTGKILSKPIYEVNGNIRTCTYFIGDPQKDVSKMYHEADNTGGNFICIKSFGDQAKKDMENIQKGTVVCVAGFVCSDLSIEERTCAHCGAASPIKAHNMFVVPNQVECLERVNPNQAAADTYTGFENGFNPCRPPQGIDTDTWLQAMVHGLCFWYHLPALAESVLTNIVYPYREDLENMTLRKIYTIATYLKKAACSSREFVDSRNREYNCNTGTLMETYNAIIASLASFSSSYSREYKTFSMEDNDKDLSALALGVDIGHLNLGYIQPLSMVGIDPRLIGFVMGMVKFYISGIEQ